MTSQSQKLRKSSNVFQTKLNSSNNLSTKLSYKTVVSFLSLTLQLRPLQLETSAQEPTTRTVNSWPVPSAVGQKCALNQQKPPGRCSSLVKVFPTVRTQCPCPSSSCQLRWSKKNAFNAFPNKSNQSKSSNLSLNLKLSNLNFRLYWRKSTELVVRSVWYLAATSITSRSWKISQKKNRNAIWVRATPQYLAHIIKGPTPHQRLTLIREINSPNDLLINSKMFNKTTANNHLLR